MKKILIIEPDDALREEYREVFGAAGFDVHTAVDGKMGLDSMWRESPDCVLLEILLPKIDGFEVVRQIRQRTQTSGTLVVFFTSLIHEDDSTRARHLGAHEYYIKADHASADIVKKIKALLR